LAREIAASSSIAVVSERVVPAVQLHDDSRLSAAKVDDEWAERVLATELEACEAAVAEERPQLSFRGRL
jgi:hypothetical protein